jgi:uncharacterized protein with von Willebrand factor type A (vWA) domain
MFLNVLAFCNLLRDLGLSVSLSRTIDVYRSLEFIQVTNKQDFYYALKTNLISSREESATFDKAFQLFWSFLFQPDQEPPPDEEDEQLDIDAPPQEQEQEQETSREEELHLEDWLKEKPDEESEEMEMASYSALEVLGQKDFSTLKPEEVRKIRQAIALVARRLATKLSRRKVPDPKGRKLDLRRTMRKNIKYGGEVVELAQRRRKVKKVRLVLICDVSGSMDCYSSFLIQFMYGLQNELAGVETVVFSTRLTRVTQLLRGRDVAKALRQISQAALDWSGGTNIGKCIKSFNDWIGRDILTPHTVAIILSDGWDRGDPALLSNEMRRLKSNCYRLIWLNPLLGSANYQPLCQGMKSALPFVDYFLPVHNLDSLLRLGKVIKPLVSH